ncbi:MAG: hypothetical protein ABI651_02750 [Verrucomicrobiota bacterium]
MKIRITQGDIDEGRHCCPCHCPVARAIRRDTGSAASRLAVCGAAIWIGRLHYRTPLDAFEFIYRFDNGDEVAPFEFELGLPTCSGPMPVRQAP